VQCAKFVPTLTVEIGGFSPPKFLGVGKNFLRLNPTQNVSANFVAIGQETAEIHCLEKSTAQKH